MKEKGTNFLSVWLRDHFHLLFKSAAVNHLRIQKCIQNNQVIYKCNLQFDSYSSLKKYQKKVRTISVSLSSAIAMTIVAFVVAPYILNPNRSSAASFQWSQSKWGTHATNPDIASATASGNKTDWTQFYSKDANVTAQDSGISLTLPVASTTAEDSEGEFTGTQSGDGFYSDGSGKLFLKKPEGSACGVSNECVGNSCSGNICAGGTLPCDASTPSGAICNFGGLNYGTVTAEDGKIWLDRNLGATQVATAFNDNNAYGWHFQWGRRADGHQIDTSATTTTLSTTDAPGNGDFIKVSVSPFDWRSPQNDNLWQGVFGINNPCPSGFRLPTQAEWAAEVSAAGITNYNTAFSSILKITAAGSRTSAGGIVGNLGVNGRYRSSTVNGIDTYNLQIDSSTATTSTSTNRAVGFSVRCIKN